MTITTEAEPTTKRPRRMAREPKVELNTNSSLQSTAPKSATGPARAPSKTSQVLAMLHRPNGATIEQLAATTGWLAHTTRAALTGLKKKGYVLASEKVEGGARVYRVTTVAVVDSAAASA